MITHPFLFFLDEAMSSVDAPPTLRSAWESLDSHTRDTFLRHLRVAGADCISEPEDENRVSDLEDEVDEKEASIEALDKQLTDLAAWLGFKPPRE